MKLPPATLRLFPDHSEETLSRRRYRDFVVERLLEHGDTEDLAWLVTAVAESELADWLGRRGGRRLSGRSRRFWECLLDAPAAPGDAIGSELWPL